MPFAISMKVASNGAKLNAPGSISLHIPEISEEQSPRACTARLLKGKYYFLRRLLGLLNEHFPKRRSQKDMPSSRNTENTQNCLAARITRNPGSAQRAPDKICEKTPIALEGHVNLSALAIHTFN